MSRPETNVAAGPPAAIPTLIPLAAPATLASAIKVAPCYRGWVVKGACAGVAGIALIAFCLAKLDWAKGPAAFQPPRSGPAFVPLQGLAPGLPMPNVRHGVPVERHESPAGDAFDQEEERLIQELRNPDLTPAKTHDIMRRFLEIQRKRAQNLRKGGR